MYLHQNANLATLLCPYYGMENWSRVWIAKRTEKNHICIFIIWHWNPGLTKTDSFAFALSKELVSFMQFNACRSLNVHRCSPSNFKPELEKLLFK